MNNLKLSKLILHGLVGLFAIVTVLHLADDQPIIDNNETLATTYFDYQRTYPVSQETYGGLNNIQHTY